MTPKIRTPLPDNASLDQRIRMVEQRLSLRRASSRLRLKLFKLQLRESITSPLALLLAAGIGFAMGPNRASASMQSSTAASPSVSGIRLLPGAVSIVSLAGSAITLWQRVRATW